MRPPAGVRIELQGICNRCGQCCAVQHQGMTLICEHLRAKWLGDVRPLGTPEASECSVYEQRVSGMPIRMLDGLGTVQLMARCYKDTWQEDHVIVERGIGKGCSLTMPVHEGELVKFTPIHNDVRKRVAQS